MFLLASLTEPVARPVIDFLRSSDGSITVEPNHPGLDGVALWSIRIVERNDVVPAFLAGHMPPRTIDVAITNMEGALLDAGPFVLALGRCDSLASVRETALACGFICIGRPF